MLLLTCALLALLNIKMNRGSPLSSSSSTSASQSLSVSFNSSTASRTPWPNDDVSDLSPLSLQDMCMLHIMLRLEEFPVESLALLPREIRRRLFLGLSHADLLHIDVETLFSDLHPDPSMDPSNCRRGPAIARKALFDAILGGDPTHFVSLDMEPVLDYFSHDESSSFSEFNVFEHICKCYRSLEPTLMPLHFRLNAILPKRFLQFVNLEHDSDSQRRKLQVPSCSAWSLLHYCNMQCAPNELKVDCYDFQKTMFWKHYEEAHLKNFQIIRQKSDSEHSALKMDPIIPFVQELLSSVEVLELGTANTPKDVDDLEEAMHTVPYVLLYNIITSSQPRLKHLKIYGIPVVADWVLRTIAELISTTDEDSKPYRYTYVPLASFPNPYSLEGLSILPFEPDLGYATDYMISSFAQSLAFNLQSIVAFQMNMLQCVTIRGIGFCYDDNAFDVRDFWEDRIETFYSDRDVNVPEYVTLLSSLFTRLLKQPQFRALSVGKSPLSGTCALIETFLTTIASHEQSLYVEGIGKQNVKKEEEEEEKEEKEEEEEEEEEVRYIFSSDSEEGSPVYHSAKRRKTTKQRKKLSKITEASTPLTWSHTINLSLPETNAQFKCLDVGHSSSYIHSLLFSLPELKLKKLRMRTQDMTLVPTDMVIEVEHVVFSTQTYTSYKPTISQAHLEKFIISNPVLKRLEFEHPTDECAPGLLSALTHCLSKFYQQGRGLEELVLNSLQFDDVDVCIIRDLFTQVRNLSHHYGTTLSLSPAYYQILSWSQEESGLLLDLSKEFQEKKIKKVIFNLPPNEHSQPPAHLTLLTEELVVHRAVHY